MGKKEKKVEIKELSPLQRKINKLKAIIKKLESK